MTHVIDYYHCIYLSEVSKFLFWVMFFLRDKIIYLSKALVRANNISKIKFLFTVVFFLCAISANYDNVCLCKYRRHNRTFVELISQCYSQIHGSKSILALHCVPTSVNMKVIQRNALCSVVL